MARLAGDTEEETEENRKKIQEWVEKGKKKELEGWTVQIKAGLPEKSRRNLKKAGNI